MGLNPGDASHFSLLWSLQAFYIIIFMKINRELKKEEKLGLLNENDYSLVSTQGSSCSSYKG